jgi:hypothetical protein
MRKAFIAALLWLACGAAFADDLLLLGVGNGKTPAASGISLKHNNFAQNGGTANTRAVTLATTTAGNFIVVGAGWCGDASCLTAHSLTVASVTSSNSGSGETCSQVSSAASAASATQTDIWYCPNIVGGSDTITVTVTGANYLAVGLSEWSGVNNASPVDAVANNATSGVSNVTSSSVATSGSTAQTGELIYTPILIGTSAAVAPGGSQTGINAVNSGLFDSYQISGATGTYTNTNSWSGATPQSASIAAFKHP